MFEYHKNYFEPEPLNLYRGIEMKNLCKVFGNNVAVESLYLNVLQDQITILAGHNGAGKTTIMSLLTGMLRPTKGTIIINNYDLRTTAFKVSQILGICPQHNILFDDLTVLEHLVFFSKLKEEPEEQIQNEIERYIHLLDMDDKVRNWFGCQNFFTVSHDIFLPARII